MAMRAFKLKLQLLVFRTVVNVGHWFIIFLYISTIRQWSNHVKVKLFFSLKKDIKKIYNKKKRQDFLFRLSCFITSFLDNRKEKKK